ncbi:uncharacterized protein LOC107463189 isoform X2 [Arachis duranensis]|uniref:Uncharacterized protein LOC107463189 isoform X2 n=1 Tax=Arachis duranensis TaxID=130453 RepID=A0A6P5MLZ5_ARADU|nr:uncharacterized protein LOC107463189 isoform X2 [Arachis duranensis]XP_029144479.1 uncharacterized protein LOC112707905 isoform X2 [Arachis hypogaea]
MGDDSRLIMEEDKDFHSLNNPSSSLIPSLTMHFSSLMIDVEDRSSIVATKTFSYNKLPSEPFTLSILKLDGSCFHVEVAKTATVAELNRAVEAVFSHTPQKWPEEIPWAHVWGQFCLCYEGRKLVIETTYLRDYGIKDGDQLRFIRHVPNTCLQRKRLKKRVVNLKIKRRSSSKANRYQQKLGCGGDDDIGFDEEYLVGKERLTGFLGGLFSYNRMAVAERARTESRVCPSSIAEGILGSFRKIRRMFSFCRRQHYYRRHT